MAKKSSKTQARKRHPLSDTSSDDADAPASTRMTATAAPELIILDSPVDDQDALAASASDADDQDFRSPISPVRGDSVSGEADAPRQTSNTIAASAATTTATTTAASAAATPTASAVATSIAAVETSESANVIDSEVFVLASNHAHGGNSDHLPNDISEEDLAEAARMSEEAESLVANLERELSEAKRRMSLFLTLMGSAETKEIKINSLESRASNASQNEDNLLSGGAPAQPPIPSGQFDDDCPIYVSDDEESPVAKTPEKEVNANKKSAFRSPDARQAASRNAAASPTAQQSSRAPGQETAAAASKQASAAAGGGPAPAQIVKRSATAAAPTPKGLAKANSAPGANEEIVIPKPHISPDACHDRKVGALIAMGWRHYDVVAALNVTRNDKGEEDTGRAHEYLERLSAGRVKRATEEHNLKSNSEYDNVEAIRKGGELAVIISMLPETADYILHLQEVHRRTRGAHSDEIGRAAANLLAHEKVRNYDRLRGMSALQMNKIALGVVHDCRECEALRIKTATAKREHEERQKHLAEQKRLEAERKEREAARLLEQQKEKALLQAQRAAGGDTPPVTDLMDDDGQLLFDPKDAKWSKNKKAKVCWNCDLGERTPGEFLHECDLCKHAFHIECTKWHKVRRRNPRADPTNIKYACHACLPCASKRMDPGGQRQGGFATG